MDTLFCDFFKPKMKAFISCMPPTTISRFANERICRFLIKVHQFLYIQKKKYNSIAGQWLCDKYRTHRAFGTIGDYTIVYTFLKD